jgi:hypothetical protein
VRALLLDADGNLFASRDVLDRWASVPRTGARSAIAAGLATVGNVCLVEPEERHARTAELKAAGVFAVVSSWGELERLLL